MARATKRPGEKMVMPTVSEAALQRYEALADELADLAMVKAKLFGMPSFRNADGKFFGGLSGDDMVFKLSGEDYDRAIALPGARAFEPMAGRPMRGWVEVPAEHEAEYAGLARAAYASLRS